jgi:DNA-binding NtrC family response regulator
MLASEQTASRKVLSVGSDPELLWLRHAVLQTAAFQVFTTADPNEAEWKMRGSKWDVLLLCHSLDRPERQHLAETFRACWPGARVVAITNKKIEKPDFADTFVYGVEGPEALIEACESVEGPTSKAG